MQENRGIIPRSVEHILSTIRKTKKTTRYRVYCSYLEIYNEKIFDLLNYNDKISHLDIREDRKKGVYVQDLTTVCVTKEEEIFALMERGAKNRSMASTDMNERSSRSHTIFQMFIEQEPLNPSSPEEAVVKVSKLNLVDLAGSVSTSYRVGILVDNSMNLGKMEHNIFVEDGRKKDSRIDIN